MTPIYAMSAPYSDVKNYLRRPRNWVRASVTRTLKTLGALVQQLSSSRADTETYLGILIKKETLLKKLDKSITETVDINNLEGELTAHCFSFVTPKHRRAVLIYLG